MAKQYFLPQAEGKLIIWLENYKVKIVEHGPALGMSNAEIDTQVAAAQAIIDDINLSRQIKNDSKQQTAAKKATKATQVPVITDKIENIKTVGGYTQDIGKDLGAIGTEDDFDADTFKPGLKVSNTQQGRLLEFVKSKTDGVNVYGRLEGEGAWNFLARDTRSPYLDSAPYPQPTELEYKVTAVIDDEEIGLDSDIVSIISQAS